MKPTHIEQVAARLPVQACNMLESLHALEVVFPALWACIPCCCCQGILTLSRIHRVASLLMCSASCFARDPMCGTPGDLEGLLAQPFLRRHGHLQRHRRVHPRSATPHQMRASFRGRVLVGAMSCLASKAQPFPLPSHQLPQLPCHMRSLFICVCMHACVQSLMLTILLAWCMPDMLFWLRVH